MKIKINTYAFDASAKTVTFMDYDSIDLSRVLLITNVTDNVIIYNFANSSLGGSVANNVLTLDYTTTSMSDTDDLQIFYYEDDMVVTEGGQKKSLVKDGTIEEVLKEMLIELKEIKLHLKIVTDEEITEGDL